MFTMAKIRNGSTYLGKHLSANDYYDKGQTIEGQWVGQAAPLLGLEGRKIGPKDLAFEALRNNRMPEHPDQKLTPRDKLDRIAFFDFQCSAQKSVSIMAVTLDDFRLLEAHDRAAAKAFGELERFASCQVGQGSDKHNEITGRVCAAAFRHDASRALDPQLHTHFVVANATWDATRGRWVGLNEFEMVKAIRYAGKVYQNELAREVQQLGYGIEHVRQRGMVTGFEIKGVSPEICKRFSKRRTEVVKGIAEYIKKHGREPTVGQIHVIATETRDPELKEITTPEVRVAQRAQLSPEESRALLQVKAQALAATKEQGVSLKTGQELTAVKQAVAHIFERKSVAPGHEILAESLNTDLGSVDLDALKKSMEAPSGGLLNLTTESPTLSAFFSTPDGLNLEKWSAEWIGKTLNSCPSLGAADFKPHKGLSEEQTRVVKEILAQRDQVYALRGVAGAGKTTTLTEINRGLEAEGKKVFYAAPTAAAAKVLRAEGFDNATTVSDFLQNVAKKENLQGSVFIVDEAGLQSNRQGADVLRLAEMNGARVILVGDSRQHVSVEAGDFLRVMEKHSKLRSSELSDIRRQTVAEYNLAVRAMASGKVAAGMEQLDQLGWIKESNVDLDQNPPGKGDYTRAAAEDYLKLTDGGKIQECTLLVTPTWAENHRVTDHIRGELKASGLLGPGQKMEVTQSLKWTFAQRVTSRNYEPGQVILFHRDSGQHRKGDRLEVVRFEKGNVMVKSPGGQEQKLSLWKARAFDVVKKREIEIAPGDKVQLLANDKKRGLINGEVLTVTKIERDGSLRCDMPPLLSRKGVPAIHRSHDRELVIPPNFREFTHGYAVTSHKSQGRTADHVVVCAERLDGKAAYVGCSRGRASCVVHTPNREKLFENLPRSGERKSALDFWKEREIRKESPTPSSRIEAWKKVAGQFVERVKAHIPRIQAFDFRRGHQMQDRARGVVINRPYQPKQRGPTMEM